MTWTYLGKPFDSALAEGQRGFVYLITNKTTGIKYIGQKRFHKKITKQKNNKKKRILVESDWQEYTGSNKVLNEHVERGDILEKEILHICSSLGWMNWLETKEIVERDALRSDAYYNEWLRARISKTHLKTPK